jgi:undecaprenyl-diphosphatase
VNWLEGIILGVVQGLTEFLPISSSGHLVVAQRALGVRMPGVMVEVILHVATLLAVCIVYWSRIVSLLRGAVTGARESWRFIGLLTLATIPAALAGGLFGEFFEGLFESVTVVGVDFLITGCILWSTRWIASSQRTEPSSGGALAIGIAQALAIFPGISRSGSTIAAGMWLRIDPVRAAEFSFLMAIPAIAGAGVLQIPDLRQETLSIGLGPLAMSFVAALVAGVAAIRLLVRLLAHGAFHRFAPYCWALGLVTLAWVVLG